MEPVQNPKPHLKPFEFFDHHTTNRPNHNRQPRRRPISVHPPQTHATPRWASNTSPKASPANPNAPTPTVHLACPNPIATSPQPPQILWLHTHWCGNRARGISPRSRPKG